MILQIFLLLFSLFPSILSLHPIQPCSSSPSITFRGQNDITRAGGPALIVFAPLQCANCYNYLRKLNELSALRSYRISVVAPDFESNHVIQRTTTAFPNIQIDRAGEGWPRLGAKNFDAIVLDSCSRVTETFQWPQSDVTTSNVIQAALDASPTKCASMGPTYTCQNQGGPTKKRVNAYLKEQEAEQLRRSQVQSQNGGQRNPNQNSNHQNHINGQQQNHQYQQNNQHQQQNQQYHQNQHNQQYHQNPQHVNHQNYQPQNQQNNQYQYQNNQNQNQPQSFQNHQQNYQQNQYYQQQNSYQNLYTPPAPTTTTTIQKVATTTTSTSTDYDYYPEGDDATMTTQSTQTQIPRPPSLSNDSPNGQSPWPTLSPFYNLPPGQWNPYGQNYPPNPKGPNPALMMDANLPCSAFTDDICHQQREQMGSLVSKCCNKGIYLTDVCIPGKCSNSTTQLCCFQKFLQAKYSCCNDPTQDDSAPKMTNQFNKCCHNLFITDDPCCPEPAAKKYWSTAYEVCMPTVTVDFSPVRFEVHFTEGVRVLDLSVDRQWEFNCTYGTKQPQFAYLPSDHVIVAVRGL